jgi:hypothetical protein
LLKAQPAKSFCPLPLIPAQPSKGPSTSPAHPAADPLWSPTVDPLAKAHESDSLRVRIYFKIRQLGVFSGYKLVEFLLYIEAEVVVISTRKATTLARY